MQIIFLPPNSYIFSSIGFLSQRAVSDTEQSECTLNTFFWEPTGTASSCKEFCCGGFNAVCFCDIFNDSIWIRPPTTPSERGWVTFLVKTPIPENCRAVFPKYSWMTLTFARFFIQVQKKPFRGQGILFVEALKSSKSK